MSDIAMSDMSGIVMSHLGFPMPNPTPGAEAKWGTR